MQRDIETRNTLYLHNRSFYINYLVADFSAQAIINTYLHKAFPNDPIIGEEDSKDLRGDEGKVLREKVHSLTNGVLDDSEKLSEEQVMILFIE